MRYSIIVAAALLSAGPALAGDARVERPIRQMEQGFNSGNVALARSAHVAAPVIVDDVTPHLWSGAGSFDRWLGDLTRSEKAQGKSNGVVALGQAVDERVSGSRAYVVMPSTYTYKRGGKTVRDDGTIAFVLIGNKAGWKIAAWTWANRATTPVD